MNKIATSAINATIRRRGTVAMIVAQVTMFFPFQSEIEKYYSYFYALQMQWYNGFCSSQRSSMVERSPHKAHVVGSIPTAGTTEWNLKFEILSLKSLDPASSAG